MARNTQYAGQPIGYSHPKQNYTMEFVSFNTKLICGVLGLKSAYMKEMPDCRELSAWEITI